MASNAQPGGVDVGKRDRHHASRSGSRTRTWLVVVLVLALVAGGAAAWRLGWADDLVDRWLTAEAPDPVTEPAAVPPPEGIDVPAIPAPRPVARAAEGGRLLPGAVRRALSSGLADRDLGRSVHVAVADLTGRGTPSYAAGEGTFTPASTMKLLTGTAALAVLGPDHRFATTVVARGRTLTLVGGGDPMLARVPGDDYPQVADVQTLARQAADALEERPGRPQPVRVSFDDTVFSGPTENPFWRADYVPDDIVSPITGLWVDEGLSADRSFRVDDPSAAAADAFADALRRAGVRVQGEPAAATAPRGATELARVESPPLSQVVEHVVEVSDNEGAEVLAHHVGLEVLGDGSFAGGARAVRQTLADLGVPLTGALVRDGSGLSRDNRLGAATLLEVLRVAGDPQQPGLRAVLTGLPVGGFTGSLAFRFDEAPEAGVGRVRAKTGSLGGVRSLAGVALDQNGTPLAFVLAADRIREMDTLDAQQDLDNVAAALGACRCSR
jgi:D-alanyl-D-alanine carboxypeptidase/D-alanyl-D-alanine-endopeptidase (penicillin-binding protein 4)